MSDWAPEVTFFLPNVSSSATRPAIITAKRDVISSYDMEIWSRSGNCITMPNARPRGMMVAL
jgi:hypothetical protein